MIRFKHRFLLLALALLLSAQTATAQGEGGDTQKVVVEKADIESLLRMIAQTAGNIDGVNDIVNSAMCAPPTVEPKVEGAECEDADSIASLNGQNVNNFRLCLASLQVALAGGGQGGNRPLPYNGECLDVTGDYRCPSGGFEIYISFSKEIDGFIYGMEYDSGTRYQYKVDDKINTISEGKYIASCRKSFVRTAFPVEGKDRYSVEEYSLGLRGKLYIDVYTAEIPGGNINKLKKLKNDTLYICEKI